MADEQEAEVAIANLNGYEVEGVNIKVEVSYWLTEVFCNFPLVFVANI